MITLVLFLVYQLTISADITWESGLYPLPARTILSPSFSVNDNIAYVFDVRGEAFDPKDPRIYKLDTTIINPTWQILPLTIPFTSTIQRDQSCQVGNKFYFFHQTERTFYIFDTTTDLFLDNSNIQLAQYNTGSSGSVVSDNNNFIYLVGGQSGTYGVYIQRYDIANNKWDILSTQAPYDKWFWLNTAVYPPQNRIYVFGGYGYPIGVSTAVDILDIYYFDLNTNTWSGSIGSMSITPASNVRLGPIVYIPESDRIYIFSGSADQVEVYDPKTNTLTFTLNSPRVCGSAGWAGAMALNNRLQIFGGTSSGVNCRTQEIYGSINGTDPCSSCGVCDDCIGGTCVPKSCSDGKYCNGDEYCDPADGECKPGVEVDCPFNMICDNNATTCVRDCDTFAIDEYLVQCSIEFNDNENEISVLASNLVKIEVELSDDISGLRGDLDELTNGILSHVGNIAEDLAEIHERIDGFKPYKKKFLSKTDGINLIENYGAENVTGGYFDAYKDGIIIGLLLMNIITMVGCGWIVLKKNSKTYKVVSVEEPNDEQKVLKQ